MTRRVDRHRDRILSLAVALIAVAIISAAPPTPASYDESGYKLAQGHVSRIYATETDCFVSLRPKHADIEYYSIVLNAAGAPAMIDTVRQAAEMNLEVGIYYVPDDGNTVTAKAIVLEIPETTTKARASAEPTGMIHQLEPCGNTGRRVKVKVAATAIVPNNGTAFAYMFRLTWKIPGTVEEASTTALGTVGQTQIPLNADVKLAPGEHTLSATLSYLDPATSTFKVLNERECKITAK